MIRFFRPLIVGTGKTVLLSAIARELRTKKTTKVTCTTGIATLQFNSLGATTIHHWSGICDGRFCDQDIVNKITNDEAYLQCKQRIQNTEALIIDEMSMLSKKNFEQINKICQNVRNNTAPFGGIQVISGGSFKQLAPIANARYLDDGDFCFNSEEWEKVFPDSHNFMLSEVLRTKEPQLSRAIGELEDSSPSASTEKLLKSLSRPLSSNIPQQQISNLFATREDVDIFNRDRLNEQPGEQQLYTSKDENVQRHHQTLFRVPKKIYLKEGAPVILQTNINISKGFVNGARGVVVQLLHDSVVVNFAGEKLNVEPHLFSIYDSLKKVTVSTRRQIPLILGYALTIHKAQGMTLRYVNVECSTIFCAGQMAVAVGRAVSLEGLCVKNYSTIAAHITHHQSVQEFYHKLSIPEEGERNILFKEDLSCCCAPDCTSPLVESCSSSSSSGASPEFSANTLPPMAMAEGEVAIYGVPNMSAFFTFDAESPETVMQSEMVYLLNNIIHTTRFLNFWNAVISKIKGELESIKKPLTKDWNQFTYSLHQFATSTEFKLLRESLFDQLPASHNAKNSLTFKIFTKAKGTCLNHKARPFLQEVDTSTTVNLDQPAQAVVRYVAGYTIGSLRKISHSTYAKNADKTYRTRWEILRGLTKPYCVITKETKYPDTLSEINRRTTAVDGSGLNCVRDEVFEFFLQIYSMAAKFITTSNIDAQAADLFKITLRSILQDETVNNSWFNLCSVHREAQEDINEQLETVTLLFLFEDIVSNFISIMLKDTKKKLVEEKGKQKTLALRKSLQQKSNKKSNNKKVKTSTSREVTPSTSREDTPSTSTMDTPSTSRENTPSTSRENYEEEEEVDFLDELEIDFPCGSCGRESVSDCIQCSLCNCWYHYACLDITGNEIFITNEEMDFYCPDCDVHIAIKKKKPRKRKLLN